MKQKPKYTGDLLRPIVVRPFIPSPINVISGADEKEVERVVHELRRKMRLLQEYYNTPPDDWYALALALARDHVPGLQFAKPQGRKVVWGDSDKAELKLAADEWLNARADKPGKRGVTAALKALQHSDRWRERLRNMTVDAMRKHYYAADPRMVQIVHAIHQIDRKANAAVSKHDGN